MSGRLSPEGAKILRSVRDYVVSHPYELDMGTWECGTSACIAGHCLRYMTGTTETVKGVLSRRVNNWSSDGRGVARVVEGLGFSRNDDNWPLHGLFYGNYENDIDVFVEQINKFLWYYGYPPNEVSDSRQAQAEAQVQEELATPLQA